MTSFLNALHTHIWNVQPSIGLDKKCVAVGKVISDGVTLVFGVPQGSVLGPKKYCLYSKPIGDICRNNQLAYHCYAGDTQVYLVIRPNDKWDDYSVLGGH